MAALRVFSRNIPYLRQQFSALLGNTSPSVKFICCVVVIGYILSFSEDVVNVLSVTPGYLLPPSFQLWSTFTFWFLEIHLWEVLIDIVTVGLCGKLIEPLWGQMEMMKFFMLTNFGVAFLTTFYYLVIFACTGQTSYLFDIHVHGLAGYLAAVSVAVKQIMPDHLLIKTPLGKLTNRSMPLLVLISAIILWAIGALEGTYPCMWGSGVVLSWIYLRFWQRHSSGSRGDMADNFSFDNFFPTVLQPVVRGILGPPHRCLVRLGVCSAQPRRVHLAISPRGVTISMPGVEPQDMERRRQIALKALSERLSKTSEQTRQKNLSTKVNMENVRKMQQTHVIPQFPSDAAETAPPAPIAEATLVDLGDQAPPITKNS
ncbi:transmembrane protein 115 [Hyposmocoma kahamanoa]|uniref:transmembrane protein 115 n=1 Tax=Hyposmocoma kahamanoa TaxID=1477025 RepID=UPI000E6D63F5|nr:transmembrane protein 115 [Hyposmocoma kahamanoa]